jgi:hypothetical protein
MGPNQKNPPGLKTSCCCFYTDHGAVILKKKYGILWIFVSLTVTLLTVVGSNGYPLPAYHFC